MIAGPNGLVMPLSSYPECDVAYGFGRPFSNMTVLIAGLGTEQERLFSTPQRSEMARFCRDHNLMASASYGKDLCEQAVIQLFQPEMVE